MQLNDLFPQFLENLGQSANNQRNYKLRLRLFLELHGQLTPDLLTPAHINQWHATIKSRGYQAATEAGYRQAVKTFCNWLVDTGRCPLSPARNLKIGSFISQRRKLPNEDNVKKCLIVARTWLQSRRPLLIRDGLIWLLSYVSGARLKEIRQLRMDDVRSSLDTGADDAGAYWVRSSGKTGEVHLGFTAEVENGFHTWLSVRPTTSKIQACFIGLKPVVTKVDTTLRYRPLSRSGLTDCYIRVSKAAGLDRPILSHALRHRKGDKLTRQFGPKVASMMLNHADPDTAATAIAYYHHPDQNDVSRALVAVDFNQDEESSDAIEIARFFGII